MSRILSGFSRIHFSQEDTFSIAGFCSLPGLLTLAQHANHLMRVVGFFILCANALFTTVFVFLLRTAEQFVQCPGAASGVECNAMHSLSASSSLDASRRLLDASSSRGHVSAFDSLRCSAVSFRHQTRRRLCAACPACPLHSTSTKGRASAGKCSCWLGTSVVAAELEFTG